MLKISNSNDNLSINNQLAIGLGFFDCLHLGHRAILDKVKHYANKLNCSVALTTFSNNFHNTLGKQEKLIYTFEERCKLFESCGVEVIIADEFNAHFSQLSSYQYFERIIAHNVKCIVCGQDYTFGQDKANADTLSTYCQQAGIKFECVRFEPYLGERVSTTRIRNALMSCDIQLANTLLAQPYSIYGQVVHGRGVGTKLGFPTANISVDSAKLLPIGVFAGHCVIDNKLYSVMLNIGNAPTYDINQVSIEAHIDDFSGQLYGQYLTITIDKYIRPIKRFDNQQQLIQQLTKDIKVIGNG